jgi:hypothetical protein
MKGKTAFSLHAPVRPASLKITPPSRWRQFSSLKPRFIRMTQKKCCLFCALILFTGLSLAGDKKQKIDSKEFERLMQTVADSWNKGDARKAADCFVENAIYSEPPDKQLYKGRIELFKFFGGNEGRKSAMKMTWHHLVFDEREQIGAGEFTFESGSKAHGVAMIKVAKGKISHWREYWYESDLDWEKFIGENKF